MAATRTCADAQERFRVSSATALRRGALGRTRGLVVFLGERFELCLRGGRARGTERTERLRRSEKFWERLENTTSPADWATLKFAV